MPVHTKLEFCNQDHKIVRPYQTKSFTATTKIEDVEAFILKKYNNSKPPFDVQIDDQHGGFVTFDKDYLEEYKPFHTETIHATTAQSTSALEPTVTLRIFLSDDDLYPAMDPQYMMVLKDLEGVPEAVTRQNEQINHSLSTVEAPKYSITLSEDPKMAFVKGYNVHNKQRDQYVCDQVNVNTGETTGTLTMIQGQKTEKNKYKRILPRFRIWNDDIKNRINQKWTLLVYIVLDVYQSGKHSLVFHPQRTFVKKDDPKQQLNPYEIPITTNDWMMDTGLELQLTTVVVEGAKKHYSSSLNLICDFKNSNKSELFDLPCNYSKSRLALVLRNGEDVQWINLVLSDEMTFEKKPVRPSVNNILNAPTNLPSTPLKRRQSNKCQNTSSNRSKRPKTSRNNNSMTVSPTNSYSCDTRLNQNLPIYIGSQCIHTEPQATTNTLVATLKFTPDSTQTRNFSGDSIDIINILGDDWNFSAGPDMDEIVLINNDLSLNDTASFDSDLLNS